MSQPSFYHPQRISGLISRLVPSNGVVGIASNGVLNTPVVNVAVLPPKTLQVVQVTTLAPMVPTTTQPCPPVLAATPSTSSYVAPQEAVPLTTTVAVADSTPDPIDLQIRNVVCMFSVCCHIDLRSLAMNCCHVMYERSKGVLIKQMRRPKCFVKIWSSGKVAISGCQSEVQAKQASRRIARMIQKILGSQVRFANYRVTNIMATCKLPFGVRIRNLAQDYPKESSYEPELNIGLLWKSVNPKATLRIHTTGSVTVTGAESQNDVLSVMEKMYAILFTYKIERPPENGTRRSPVCPTKHPESSGYLRDPDFTEEDFVFGNGDLDSPELF